MKRICNLFIVFCMSFFVLFGCGKSDSNESKDSSSSQSSENVDLPETSSEEDEAEEQEDAEKKAVYSVIDYVTKTSSDGVLGIDDGTKTNSVGYLSESDLEKIDVGKTGYNITKSALGDSGWDIYGKVYFYDSYENVINACEFETVDSEIKNLTFLY